MAPQKDKLTNQDWNVDHEVMLLQVMRDYEYGGEMEFLKGAAVRDISPELSRFTTAVLGPKIIKLRKAVAENEEYDPRKVPTASSATGNKRAKTSGAGTPSSSSAAGASAMAAAAFKTPSKPASIAKPAATSPSTPLAVANHMYLRALARNVKSSESLVLHDFWRFQIPGIGGDKYHLAILLRLVKGYQYRTEVAGRLFTYVMYPEDLNPTAVVNPNAKISDAETQSIVQYFGNPNANEKYSYTIELPEAIDSGELYRREIFKTRETMAFSEDGEEEGLVFIKEKACEEAGIQLETTCMEAHNQHGEIDGWFRTAMDTVRANLAETGAQGAVVRHAGVRDAVLEP
ncbi:hypothetical protein HDU98_002269, partial [Podochytrium sp. JEL0797]